MTYITALLDFKNFSFGRFRIMAQKILDEGSHLDDEKRTISMTNKGRSLMSGNIFFGHCECRLATSRYKE